MSFKRFVLFAIASLVSLAACAQIIGGGTMVHNHSGTTSGGATLNGTTCVSCTFTAPVITGGITANTLHVTGTSTLDGAVTAGSTLGVTGTLTGAAANFSGLVNASAGNGTTGLSVTSNTTGDQLRLIPQAAGSGPVINARNSADSAYAPFTVQSTINTFTGPLTVASPLIATGTNLGAAGSIWFGSDGLGGAAINTPTGKNIIFAVNQAEVGRMNSTTFSALGIGPHSIGGATIASYQWYQTGAWPSLSAFVLDSTLTPGTNNSGSVMLLNPQINKASSGTQTDFTYLDITAGAIGAGAGTLTNATSLKIRGAPNVGTNQRALWVVSGNSEFDGYVGINVTPAAPGRLYVDTTTANDTGIRSNQRATTGTNYGGDFEATGSGATTNVGMYLAANGATNNYGLQIASGNPGAGANNYAIKSDSAAQSLFSGPVTFSSTISTPTQGAGTFYETGTWTPSVTFGGAAVGLTYTTRTAQYTKVGKLAIAMFDIVLSAKGSSTGQLQISGLPFTADAASSGQFHAVRPVALNVTVYAVYMAPGVGTTVLTPFKVTAAAASPFATMAETDVTNTTEFHGAIIYMTQ